MDTLPFRFSRDGSWDTFLFALLEVKEEKKKISRALVNKYLPFTVETVQAAKSIFVTRQIIYRFSQG